jgi:hypothetical protein
MDPDELQELKAYLEDEQKRLENYRRFSAYPNDPVGYAHNILGVKLWSKQIEIANAVQKYRRVLVKAGHGVGKTFLAAALVNWHFDSFDPSLTITTAPTWPQVKDVLWSEINDLRPNDAPGEPLTLRIKDEYSPKHLAYGMSPKVSKSSDEMGSTAMQGRHAEHMLVVLDEGPGIAPEVWMGLDSIATGQSNHILAIGNPTVSHGYFYNAARRAQKDNSWHVITVSTLEHPNIQAQLDGKPPIFPGAVTLDWIEDKLTNPMWCQRVSMNEITPDCFEFPPNSNEWYKPKPMAEAKMLGRFPTTQTDNLFNITHIEQARMRETYSEEDGSTDWDSLNDLPLTVGIDVARHGADKTVLFFRRGWVVFKCEYWIKADLDDSANRALHSILMVANRDDRVTVRIDDVGSGGAITDILSTKAPPNWDIVPYNGGASPNVPEQYDYLRSETHFAIAQTLADTPVDLSRIEEEDYEMLLSELTSITWDTDARNRRYVHKKSKIKSRIGRSPDFADAFVLCMVNKPYYHASPRGPRRPSKWRNPTKSLLGSGRRNFKYA